MVRQEQRRKNKRNFRKVIRTVKKVGRIGGKVMRFAARNSVPYGNLISNITGSGDYKITNSTKNDIVKFRTKTYRFQHREYIQNIVTSPTAGGYIVDTVSVQAASSLCFPWMSKIVKNFSRYKIHGMVFEFVS